MGKTDRFSSRWGLIAATLGMAVGAGNIWRFPRVASQNGGGAFMAAWLVALFAWSIPLLIIEFSWGRKTRRGPIGAFVTMLGRHWAWAGGFVALCCTAIMFYYAVVSGWCIYYLARSAFIGLRAAAVQAEWERFIGSGWAVLSLALAVGAAGAVVMLGVRRGIERACVILVPALFILLAIAAVRSLLLPGAQVGLQHLFKPDFRPLLGHRVWLEAFTQSAWSTGAGWGLLLVYAGYSSKREDVVLGSFITGLGNNAASLLAALAVVPAIFALAPAGKAIEIVSAGNEGLAFVWIPRLFLGGGMAGGRLLLVVFFAALALAALSSLIAMVEMAVRTLTDVGVRRGRAIVIISVAGFCLGFPSAVNMSFFKNQDWVWGLGLLISGALFALGAIRYGVGRLRRENNEIGQGIRLGCWFDLIVLVVIPVAIVAMLGWWFYQSAQWSPRGWLDPLGTSTVGTCLVQWGGALALLLVLNRFLARRAVSAVDVEGGS
ncbi:MAG TPA: sodium-dependent transporter [Myxococcota bacterium]|nr:sodium-dependent transporter [Myxococcota bacterium]